MTCESWMHQEKSLPIQSRDFVSCGAWSGTNLYGVETAIRENISAAQSYAKVGQEAIAKAELPDCGRAHPTHHVAPRVPSP